MSAWKENYQFNRKIEKKIPIYVHMCMPTVTPSL